MKKQLTTFCLLLLVQFSFAQSDFLEEATRFTDNKDAFITLTDGTELVGRIEDVDRKKGMINFVEIKANGKKVKLKPEEIKSAFLPPTGLSKFTNAYGVVGDVNKMSKDASANKSLVKDGYFYFETTDVVVKKKKYTVLLQLLNPASASKIKVFNDPLAKESMSFGIGPVTLAGGDAKSYLVKVGEEVAFKLEKKNYEEEMTHLFKDCDKIKEMYPEMKWTELNKHVFTYDTLCP